MEEKLLFEMKKTFINFYKNNEDEFLEELSCIRTSLMIDFNIENPTVKQVEIIFMNLESYQFGLGLQENFGETEARNAVWDWMKDEKTFLLGKLNEKEISKF